MDTEKPTPESLPNPFSIAWRGENECGETGWDNKSGGFFSMYP